MAKQFDPRKVLRQITNDLLRQFFTARDELAGVPWQDLSETDVQAVFDAWQGLPEPKRREVQVALQDINELADDRGLGVLAEEIQWRCPMRMEEFVAIESRVDKAMWVYLTVPLAFDEAARFARADALSIGRYWHKRNGLPKLALQVTDDMKRSLEQALVGFYPEAQGRGYWCAVEHYSRANGNEYFFAYLDNYPDSRLVFDDAGAMHKQRERGAFDNVFVYCPQDGTMEIFVHGGKKVREPLEALFCEATLGTLVEPADANRAAYELDGLKDPGFAFPTDPGDCIAEVRIRRLRLEVISSPGQRVTLEAGPKDHRNAIHHMIKNYLNAQNLPMSAVRVIQVTFMLTFQSENGAKARTLTFDVSHPSSSDLKSKADDLRAIGERCLKLWRITRD
jgi:hypothetical protein